MTAPEFTQHFQALLTYKKCENRQYAAQALGLIGDRSAAEPLVRLLNAKDETIVHSAAAIALGRLKDERAIEPLCQVLAEERNHSKLLRQRAGGETSRLVSAERDAADVFGLSLHAGG